MCGRYRLSRRKQIVEEHRDQASLLRRCAADFPTQVHLVAVDYRWDNWVMDVWLQTWGAAKSLSFAFRLVRSPQATAMTQNTAPETMLSARREYPDYVWEMESGFNDGEFVVRGRKM